MTDTTTPTGTLASPYDPQAVGTDIASLLPPLSQIPDKFVGPDGKWQQVARYIDQKGYGDLRFRLHEHRPDINVHKAIWHISTILRSWDIEPIGYKMAAAAFLMSLWFADAMLDPVDPSVSHDEDIPIFLRRPETKIAPAPSRPSPTQAVIEGQGAYVLGDYTQIVSRWARFSPDELQVLWDGLNTSPLIYKGLGLSLLAREIRAEIAARKAGVPS